MLYELDKELVDFLCRKKLTFTQFSICLLVHRKDVATIIRMEEEVGKLGDNLIALGDGKYKTEIDDLLDRGYLITEKVNKKFDYHIDNLIVTQKFLHGFIDDKLDMAQEFWDTYPKNLMINGAAVPSTVCDYDEFTAKYLKAIKNSPRLHKEIIGKLQAAKEDYPYAIMSIMNFVGSRHWEQMNEQSAKVKSRTY